MLEFTNNKTACIPASSGEQIPEEARVSCVQLTKHRHAKSFYTHVKVFEYNCHVPYVCAIYCILCVGYFH